MSLPTLGGNWVDLIIIVFLLFSLFEGWQKGFLAGFFNLLSFLLAFLLALKFYPLGANLLTANFSLSLGLAKATGFLLIAILTETALSFLFNSQALRITPKISQSFFNHFFGLFPAILRTLIFAAFVLSLLLVLPLRGQVKKDILSSQVGKILVSQTQGIERQLSQVFGEAAEETLNFFTIKPQGKETVDLNFVQKELTRDLTSEKIMFTLVNNERSQKGRPELVWDEKLAAVARAHAQDMFEKGYFSHYDPSGFSPADRLEKAGISFLVTGENLALAPSVELAHEGLMKSEGHRENILASDFGRVGIGVVDGGFYGKMFVQEFSD